jgi:hypothetical protein
MSSVSGSSPGNDQGRISNHPTSSSAVPDSQVQDGQSQDGTALNTPASGLSSSAHVPPFPPCACSTSASQEDVVLSESDEVLLSIYMNQLSNRFPFVIIPPGTTVQHLKATRPFLLKVIRMVASVRNLRSVRAQSQAIIRYISDAMLMRSERSLDLLQGILVFLGYYHYHCMVHAQFNNLTHLAVSLVEDMSLTSCPKTPDKRCPLPMRRGEELRARTNEERRALVGVWYMSSK